jgi:hypothetical protein
MLPPPYNVDDDPIIPQYDGNVTIDSLNSSVNFQSESTPKTIPVIISENRDYVASNISSQRNCQAQPKPNIRTIKRSNQCLQALELPTVVNLNPRSVYNKIDEFHTLVSELQVDLVCMSESWERESLTLDQIIDLEDHQVISNVHQRTGMGGRPAIIVNNKKFDVQNLTNTSQHSLWGGSDLGTLNPKKYFQYKCCKENSCSLHIFQAFLQKENPPVRPYSRNLSHVMFQISEWLAFHLGWRHK